MMRFAEDGMGAPEQPHATAVSDAGDTLTP